MNYQITGPKNYEHQLHVTGLDLKVAKDLMWRIREDNEHLRVSAEVLPNGNVLVESIDCLAIQNNQDLVKELEAIASRAYNGEPERVYPDEY